MQQELRKPTLTRQLAVNLAVRCPAPQVMGGSPDSTYVLDVHEVQGILVSQLIQPPGHAGARSPKFKSGHGGGTNDLTTCKGGIPLHQR
eukprot:425731-Amphidinium_carterae.1